MYRLLSYPSRRVYYVGITRRPMRERCAEHGVRLANCQPVARVANRGTARAMEQLLIEHYGFDSAVSPFIINRNWDDGSDANTGWLNGARYRLRNTRREFSPTNRGLYCAASAWRSPRSTSIRRSSLA